MSRLNWTGLSSKRSSMQQAKANAWELRSSQLIVGPATETGKTYLALAELAVVMLGLTVILTATTSGELTGAQQRQMQRQTARITVYSGIQLTRWGAARIGPLSDAVCVALKTDNPSNQKEAGNLAVPFFISPLPPLSRSGISFVF